MKRRALLAHLQEHGCAPVREGGSHSIWIQPPTGRKEAIPHHKEVKKPLARSICCNLSEPVPAGDCNRPGSFRAQSELGLLEKVSSS